MSSEDRLLFLSRCFGSRVIKLIMIEPMLDIAFSVLRALSRTHRLIYGCNLAEKIELLLSMYLSHLLALNNELCFYAVLFSFVYFQSNGTFVGLVAMRCTSTSTLDYTAHCTGTVQQAA